MYGKHFESMYEGSMYGAGVAVFAVWGYVIAHVRKSRVELNPVKLADTLGGDVKEMASAIEVLMKPDANSRHKEHDGRRLLREGQFQYFVPSWESYQGIRNSDDRREYNKIKQREYRAKKRSKPLAGEMAAVKAEARGDYAGAAAIAAAGLPETPVKVNGEPPLDMPEIPLNEPQEPPTESGRMVDGEWVPD